MRKDYEQHLAECLYCKTRQRIHRTIDVTLISLSTVSAVVFLLALAVIHRVAPLHHWAIAQLHLRQMTLVLSLQLAAFAGLLVSLITWVVVALVTPAPVYLRGVAIHQAKVLQSRIPNELRERLPRNVA